MTEYNYKGITINSKDVKPEDMPNELFEEIFELCGADTALSLLIFMTGNVIQVPVKGLAKYEKRIILENYDGTSASIRALQRKLCLSETYIRDVLKSGFSDGRSPVSDDQEPTEAKPRRRYGQSAKKIQDSGFLRKADGGGEEAAKQRVADGQQSFDFLTGDRL